MTETCEMQDTLVSNSGVAKGMPGRVQTVPNACYTIPLNLQKRLRYSNGTVKYSIKAVGIYNPLGKIVHSYSCIVILSLTQ